MLEYNKRKQYSNDTLTKLRADISDKDWNNIAVITVGSYARREANSSSDLDYFLISKCSITKVQEEPMLQELDVILKKYEIEAPSVGGAFNCIEQFESMTEQIGGNDDTNPKITKRILVLMEGEYLSNQELFKELKNKLIERYLEDVDSFHIPRFLLSDFIRYYRTICVDFEFKTIEKDKPWGIRKVKLVFARKLMYFSGIAVAAELSKYNKEDAVEQLQMLLELPVIERLQKIFGKSECNAALEIYDGFLKKMAVSQTREELKKISSRNDRNDSDLYKDFKQSGKKLTAELNIMLKNRFNEKHPIHLALVY